MLRAAHMWRKTPLVILLVVAIFFSLRYAFTSVNPHLNFQQQQAGQNGALGGNQAANGGGITRGFLGGNGIDRSSWLRWSTDAPKPSVLHPIDQLMAEAQREAADMLRRQSKTLEQAVARYIEKYHRQPPPYFDKWFEYAKKRNCTIIDDYDQIMHDLDPYWGMEPASIRASMQRVAAHPDNLVQIFVKNGKVSSTHGHDKGDAVMRLMRHFVQYLPDMSFILNQQDEPRVVADYSQVNKTLEEGHKQLRLNLEHGTRNELHPMKTENVADDSFKWTDLLFKPLYDYFRRACAKDSPFFTTQLPQIWYDVPVNNEYSQYFTTDVGHFVQNFTAQRDICRQPDMRNLNSAIIRPNTAMFVDELIPIFSECKLSMQNDIVIPATMYYRDWDNYIYHPERDYEWEDKFDDFYWLGTSNGGPHVEHTIRGMQRSRLVQLLNSSVPRQSKILLETTDPVQAYQEASVDISRFLRNSADAGFTQLRYCYDYCNEMHHMFEVKSDRSFSENWNHKYLIDIDGHSHSARFRAFQLSNSVSIKSTLFVEWHDQRLIPWYHFIPLDSRFIELDSIMTYFLGFESSAGRIHAHSKEGNELAQNGRRWAEQALRVADMEAYMFRLLLEYARIMDDDRINLGYTLASKDTEEKAEKAENNSH